MADKGRKIVDKMLVAMERRLSAIYKQADEELSEKVDKYFEKFKVLDARNKAKVEAGKMTAEEYKTWKYNKIMTGKSWQRLKAKTAQSMLKTNEIANAYVNDQLPKIYAASYNEAGMDLGRLVKGYNFDAVNTDTVKYLATKDRNLLPYKIVDGEKDIRWNTKKITNEVLQGLLQGESMDEVADRFSKVLGMNESSAIRNARTTVTSAENKGRQDSYIRGKEKGIIMKKEWMCIHDKHTRQAHWDLDGQQVDVDEPFESELGDIMYPGDPNADPANVYNCRCTMKTVIVGFEPTGEEDG